MTIISGKGHSIITRNNVTPAMSEEISPKPPCMYRPAEKAMADKAMAHGTTISSRARWRRLDGLAFCLFFMDSESVNRGILDPPSLKP